MLTYTELQGNRRKFLALTGLTLPEFQRLLPAFTDSYEALFATGQTLTGRPRQRFPGGLPGRVASPGRETGVHSRLSQNISPASSQGRTLRPESTRGELLDSPVGACPAQ